MPFQDSCKEPRSQAYRDLFILMAKVPVSTARMVLVRMAATRRIIALGHVTGEQNFWSEYPEMFNVRRKNRYTGTV